MGLSNEILCSESSGSIGSVSKHFLLFSQPLKEKRNSFFADVLVHTTTNLSGIFMHACLCHPYINLLCYTTMYGGMRILCIIIV